MYRKNQGHLKNLKGKDTETYKYYRKQSDFYYAWNYLVKIRKDTYIGLAKKFIWVFLITSSGKI